MKSTINRSIYIHKFRCGNALVIPNENGIYENAKLQIELDNFMNFIQFTYCQMHDISKKKKTKRNEKDGILYIMVFGVPMNS